VAFAFAVFPFEDTAAGAWSGDFLRGGNPFSVAAEKALEVDAEVGLDHFLDVVARVVAED
jgi:hypothetical protein